MHDVNDLAAIAEPGRHTSGLDWRLFEAVRYVAICQCDGYTLFITVSSLEGH